MKSDADIHNTSSTHAALSCSTVLRCWLDVQWTQTHLQLGLSARWVSVHVSESSQAGRFSQVAARMPYSVLGQVASYPVQFNLESRVRLNPLFVQLLLCL
jgi:hypothetical protein